MPIITQIKQHKLLLDTHVWIWLMTGNKELAVSFRNAVARCQSHDGILLSAISLWEIGMLVEKKRITIDMDCLDWIEQSLSYPGVRLIPISPRIAVQSTRLPGAIHGDPADRILVATAHEENAVFVTCDQKLIDYGKDHYIAVHNPQQ